MKQIKLIYALLLAVTLPLLTACYNDDATTVDTPTQQDGKIKVHLRVSQAAPTTTRASWQDNNATDDEMMNVWTVVAVEHETNNVIGIWSCQPIVDSEKEIDDIDDIEEFVVELEKDKKYRFYSFANMAAADLGTMLGLSGKIPTPTNDGKIVSATADLTDCTLIEEIVEDIAVNVEGNGFNPKADNGFGGKGIPMSNVQIFNSLNDGDKKDLIVIRMLAKIKLQIYNDRGTNLTINSIKLTNLTKNENNNLKLLPKLKKGQDTMESNPDYHGDIEPNLNGIPTRDEYVYKPAEGKKMINKEITSTSSNNPVEYVFYVNESDVRKQSTRAAEDAPDFYHFFLEIEVEGDNSVGDKKARYVMIDDERDSEGNIKDDWGYIARNDYRIIPIVLDDYKLDMIPYDFPAIGVYPASVKEEDGIYTINFHDYGHFHLLPQVTRYSEPTDYVSFTTTTPDETSYTKTTWGLVKNSFKASWSSWTDATKATPYNNATGNFYRVQAADTDGDEAADTDGDEAGGMPAWYSNTSSPQWQPNANATIGYQPFIFGYINNPGQTMDGDNKVYHEFSIYLYKERMSTPRQMTYRLYMILDKSQMMYPKSSRRHGVSAVRHTHGY